MNTRKLFCMALLCALLCAVHARAADGGLLQVTDTPLRQEFEDLWPTLTADIDRALEGEGLSSIQEEDVDLEAMFPYYRNDRFFSPEIRDAADFQARIGAQEYYLWMLPLSVDGREVLVAVGRTRPVAEAARSVLTEEETAELESREGKWSYMWLRVAPEGERGNWKTRALERLPQADAIYLVNGLASTNAVMAVAIENGALTEAVCVSEADFSLEERAAAAFRAADGPAVSGGTVSLRLGDTFRYADLQKTLGRLVPQEGTFLTGSGSGVYQLEGGASSSPLPWVLLAVLLLVAAVAVVLMRRRPRAAP